MASKTTVMIGKPYVTYDSTSSEALIVFHIPMEYGFTD